MRIAARLLLGPAACALLALAACGSPPVVSEVEPTATASTQEAAMTPIVDDDGASSSSPSVSPAGESTVSPSASASAAPTAVPRATPKPGTVTVTPILMYHYIRELPANTTDQLGYGLSISPKLFDDQLSYLSTAGYHTISMSDLVGHMLKGAPLPPKPIVLTFDDGYSDFYTAAWPALKRHNMTATAYIVVDFLGKPGYMSWQQLQDLRDSGFEIGAHTMDHVDLAIQNPAQAKHQVADSRLILQQRLGLPIDAFAYPSGRYNQTTVKIVGDTGFSSAVTTNFGSHHTTANLLTLARVRVPGGISMPNFIKNLG